MATVVLVLSVVLLLVAGAVAVAVRRRHETERRRAAALAALADRIDAAVAALSPSALGAGAERVPYVSPQPSPAPAVADGLAGRAAFVDALCEQVDRARADGVRLSTALVRGAGDEGAEELADGVREVVDAVPYAVGPRAVAIVLPGLGRADALGTLARIEASRASTGRAVELEEGERAVDLVVRLLSAGPGGVGDRAA